MFLGGIALLLTFSAPVRAEEFDCQQLRAQWMAQVSKPAADAKVRQWVEYQTRLRAEWVRIATRLKEAYFTRKLQESEILAFRTCLTAEEFSQVEASLQFQVWETLIDSFLKSGGLRRQLAQAIRAKSTAHLQILHPWQEHTEIHKGSFHRSSKSVTLNLAQLDPSEIEVIAAHEIAHALDRELEQGIVLYNDPRLRTEIENSLKTLETTLIGQNRQQQPAAQTTLDRWLEAGLNRGYFAEVRAWTITFLVYLEGRKKGDLASMPWIDSILQQQRSQEPMPYFVARYLDPHFTDPTEDWFAVEWVQKSLQALREQVRKDPGRIPWSELFQGFISLKASEKTQRSDGSN